MKVRQLLVLSALVATAAHSAAAQRITPSPFKFTVFAGAAIPVGDGSDEVELGYTAGVAVDMRVPASAFGVRAEGLYAAYSSNQKVAGFDGTFSDLGLNLNAVAWFPTPTGGTITPYVTGGPSFSHIKAEAKSGSTTISTTDNRWGFNVGGGIEFALGTLGARLDARYKRISLEAGDSYGSVPITFGIRF